MGCGATRRSPTGKMSPGSEARTIHVGPGGVGLGGGGQGGVTAVSSFGAVPETLPIRGFPTVTTGPVHLASVMFTGQTVDRTNS